MMASAFTAWLTGHSKQGQGFQEYCRGLGLIEADTVTKDEARVIAEYAKCKAAAIVAADQKGPVNA